MGISLGLLNKFQAQENPYFCGPGSAAIVLNALRSKGGSVFTQKSFFCELSSKIKTVAQVCGEKHFEDQIIHGLQLSQLREMIELKGVSAKLTYAVESGRLAMKESLKAALQEKDTYVIANYYRPKLGQKGRGHFSPLAAYDQRTDSFLILDVNPKVQRPCWVKADALVDALTVMDGLRPRGFLTIRKMPICN